MNCADSDSQKAAFKRHIDAQQELYGPNVIVCLVNHHGSEGGMHDEYSKHMNELYHDSAHKYCLLKYALFFASNT